MTTTELTEQRRPVGKRLVVLGIVVGFLGAVSAGLSLVIAALDFSTWSDFSHEIDLCGQQVKGFWGFWESSFPFVEAGLGLALVLGIFSATFALASGRRLMAGLALATIVVLAPLPWVIQVGRAGDSIGCHQL